MADSIGLDIGSAVVKAVQLRGRELSALGHIPVPKDALLITDQKESWGKYSETISGLITGGGFRGNRVVVALPESQIFSRVVTFPQMAEKDLASAVRNEAQQYVPLPLEQTVLDYVILGPSEMNPEQTDILLVAAPKSLVDQYIRVLRYARLEPASLEPETMALARSVAGDTTKEPVMVASMGAKTTDLSIFSGNVVRFTRSISTGGEALARAISQGFNLESSQAREYLQSYGLLEEGGGKVQAAIKPVFDIITEEIRRVLTFYSARKGRQVRRLILVGGVANLPGVVIYLAEVLGIEVLRGDPWKNLTAPGNIAREELTKMAPDFAIAVGLALKGV